MPNHILIVDDEEDIIETLRLFLEKDGHIVHGALDASEAVQILDKFPIDVVVSDIILPRQSGVQLLATIRNYCPDVLVILMTGEPTIETAAEAVRKDAFDYLAKPISGKQIRFIVDRAIKVKKIADENRRLDEENKRYKEHLEDLVEQRTKQLQISQTKYQQLIEGLPILVFEYDIDHNKILFFKGNLLNKLGYQSSNMIEMNSWLDKIHPDDRSRLRKTMQRMLQNQKAEGSIEFRVQSNRNQEVWVTYIPRFISDSKQNLLHGILIDISEKKQAEENQRKLQLELQQAREKQERSLLNNLELSERRTSPPKLSENNTTTTPFFGSTPVMREVFELTRLSTEHREPVLIGGETGTGKGLFASWIHHNSSLSQKPFVSLNCTNLKGDLLSSELFGHAKGAFTSAISDRRGLIEEADGGTLFLDEIGDMELGVQGALLKVLEEKTFRRLGEVKERRSNFRLICATNRDLRHDVDLGKFRNDLYYRINVFPINIPPLRDRFADFMEIIRNLLENLGVSQYKIASQTYDFLLSYHWPGNIRELKNYLIRAALLARDRTILPEHFHELSMKKSESVHVNTPITFQQPPTASFSEKDNILALLKLYDGNRSKVARELGMSRNTLYRRLKEYNIEDC